MYALETEFFFPLCFLNRIMYNESRGETYEWKFNECEIHEDVTLTAQLRIAGCGVF